MKPTGEDDLWPRPQFCSIYCPKCGRPAARLVYQTPVARYLHYSRTGAYWHTAILDGNRLTYKSKDGSWGLKGLSWEQLVALPPRVYGALAKLKQMEDLVDDIGGAQPEVGGLALEELLTMGTDGIHANMREAMKWYRKRFETVT